MEAQLEYIHDAYTFFACLAPDLYAQSVLIKKNSASELKRKFIKSALLVGWEAFDLQPPSVARLVWARFAC